MRRSWAFLFYDLALFVLLVLPLGVAFALLNDRSKAVGIYSAVFVATLIGVVVTSRYSKLSVSHYWRALSQPR